MGALEAADELRRRASFFVSQRRKDLQLYRVLADVYALCATCSAQDVEAFRAAVIDRAGRRAYFESDADVFLVVGRYVFESPDRRRDAAWRYTAAMREASKRQIRPSDFAGWLAVNGGINALFKTRPVESRTACTRTLSLTEAVTVPKDGSFTLTLRRTSVGAFEVLALEWAE